MLRSTLLLLTALLLSPAALASLSIDRSILLFAAGESPRQDVMAGNDGDTNLFLEVEVDDRMAGGGAAGGHRRRATLLKHQALNPIPAE